MARQQEGDSIYLFNSVIVRYIKINDLKKIEKQLGFY